MKIENFKAHEISLKSQIHELKERLEEAVKSNEHLTHKVKNLKTKVR